MRAGGPTHEDGPMLESGRDRLLTAYREAYR